MDTEKVIRFYDDISEEYANEFFNELDKKHLDRILLEAFAKENGSKGTMADFGCGPGQTTKFLSEQGVKAIVGIDISPAIIQKAQSLNPSLKFEEGDLVNLKYPDFHFASAIAFYAFVHFNETALRMALKEIHRVLADNGEFLFSFHAGDETIHLDEFHSKKVDIDFHFFQKERVAELAEEHEFSIVDLIERKPYPGAEFPSRRVYLWLRKI